ncbi:MAG TPA: endonuclease/exonuclease/phosphatase family protein [Alphaproteobacteria bacterium]|nr:hypothetical protein [Rhodospirillaceae bacterium]HRJ67267.1 endonuclease/exonuclease/phosphatase family protein [Alphaproteobacteria bacterium]
MAEQAINSKPQGDAWRKPLRGLVYIGAAGAVLGSITPFMPISALLTDLPSHFAAYYFIGLFFLAALAAAALPLDFSPRAHKAVWGALALGFALNTWTLAPYYLPAPKTKPATSFKILQANVLFLNQDTDALQKLIAAENPDVIALSEINAAHAAFLKKLAAAYPHYLIEPSRDARGLAFLSRLPTLAIKRVSFADASVPAHVATLDINEHTVRILSLHPRTPLHGLALRDADFAAITKEFSAHKDTPLVVTGDFNATPWCPALKKLKTGLSLTDARNGYGLNGTWPVWLPAPLRLPIDHVLVSEKISVQGYKLAPATGSDHLPTVAVLSLRTD